MNWDQPVHSFSYPNGEPQTPTRTPTSPCFGDTSFQTPKLESSFYDPRVTWNTADPYASSPEFLRTPQRFDTSQPPNQWGQHTRTDITPETISLQRSPNPGSAVTAIIRSGNNASPIASDATKRTRAGKRTSWTGDDESRDIDSAKRNAGSMQTPPPTSTSRRKVHGYNAEGTGEPSTKNSRRLSIQSTGPAQLDTPSRVAGVSPRLLWGLQNSPDLFQVPSTGPVASPLFPQHRLFWDGDSAQQQDGNVNPSDPYGDPFSSNSRSAASDTFAIGSPEPPNDLPQLPIMPGSLKAHHMNTSGIASGPNIPEHPFTTSFSTSPRVTSADDPSMFLSSPARRFGPPEPRAEAALPPRKSRQPYHYQIEESRREEELRRAKSQGRNLASFPWDEEDDEPPPSIRGGRPEVRRSSTHTGLNPSSHGRQSRPLSFSGSAAPSGVRKTPTRGRLSPLKARLHPTQRSFSVAPAEPPPQPLVLKIDKDGRAKTEVKTTHPSSLAAMDMDLDGSSTESDSNASDEYPAVAASRNTSFTFPEPSPHRPKYARSQSTSRPHSKSSSYSSTATSHSGRRSPWAESSRGRPSSQIASRHENRIQTPRSGSFHPIREHMRGPSGSSTALPDVEEDSGDAQQALKLVMNARGRQPRPRAPGYPPSTRGSSRSSGQMRSSPPVCRSQFDFQSDDASASPLTATDSDFATPSTTRQSNPSNGTRCICNSMDNGGHLMIQCESCTHWLHTKCVGLNRQNLPPVYVCVYCAQTPMRGGRIREPPASTRNMSMPSPLAHKSYRFR